MSAIGILVLCTGLLLEMSPRRGLVMADISDRAMKVPEPDQDYTEGTSNKTEPELRARKIQGPTEPSGLASQETTGPQTTKFFATTPSSTLTPATQHPVEGPSGTEPLTDAPSSAEIDSDLAKVPSTLTPVTQNPVEEPSGKEPLTGAPLSAELIDSDLPKVTEARHDAKVYEVKFDETQRTTRMGSETLTDANSGSHVNENHATQRVFSRILSHVINLFTRARRLASRSFRIPLQSESQTRGESLIGDDRQVSDSSDGQNQDTMSQPNLSRYNTTSVGSDARGNDSGVKPEESLPRSNDYTISDDGQKHDQEGEPQLSDTTFSGLRKKENYPNTAQNGEGMSRSSDDNNKGDSSTHGRIYSSRLGDYDVTSGKSGAHENYFRKTQSAEKISRLSNYNSINEGLVKGRKFLVGPLSGGISHGSDSLGTKLSVTPTFLDTNKWLNNLPVGREMTSPEIFPFKEDEGQRAEASGTRRVRRDSLNMPVGIIPQTMPDNIPQTRKEFIPEMLENKIPETPKQAIHQTPKDTTPPIPREVTSPTPRQEISQTPRLTIGQKPKEIIPPTQGEKNPQKPKEVHFQSPKVVSTKTSNGSITQAPLEVTPLSQKEVNTTWKPVEFTFNPNGSNDDDNDDVCNGTKATPEEKKNMEETERKKQEEKKKEDEEKRRTISKSPKEAGTTWTPIEFEFNPNGDDDKGCDGKELTPEQKKKREEKKKKKEEEEKKKKEEEKKKEQEEKKKEQEEKKKEEEEEKKKEEEERKKEKEEELEEQRREKAEELEEQKREREEELEEQRREREEELEEQKREREEELEERRREEAEREKEESWQDDDDGFRFMNPNFS